MACKKKTLFYSKLKSPLYKPLFSLFLSDFDNDSSVYILIQLLKNYPMTDQKKDELKQLIAEGRMDEVINYLRHLKQKNSEFKNNALIIYAQYKHLEQSKIKGDLTTEEIEVKQTKINDRLFRLIDSVKNNQEEANENTLAGKSRLKVQSRIKESCETHNPKLDLSGCGLKEVPEEVYAMHWIKVLNLSSNNSYEKSFRGMFKKKMLELIQNTPSASNLHKQLLGIYFELMRSWTQYIKEDNATFQKNELTTLDERLGKLANLQILLLDGNEITSFPSCIAQLKNLQFLSIAENNLTQIPDFIGNLEELQVLYLADNKLTEISPQIGFLKNLQFLDMPNNLLPKLPKSLKKLQNLQFLDLANNQLKNILPYLTQLTKLNVLTLANNHLEKLPDHFHRLQSLNVLSLAGNKLTALPKTFQQLEQLRVLSLANNQLAEIPKQLTQLQYLKFLYLSDNQITEIPDYIVWLQDLRFLYLANNQLTDFSPSLMSLSQLQRLDLAKNTIKEIPDSITDLIQLSHVSIADNKIQVLSKEFIYMPSLQSLYLAGNPLRDVPGVIFDKRRERGRWENGIWTEAKNVLTTVREHFRSLKKGAYRLFEAKLLIVGEGGVGKTSMQYKLKNNAFVAGRGNPKSTEGISIVRHIYYDDWKGEKQIFKLNIWDFGGQEIYHATHQFFLTKHSLYLLVWDSRKEIRQAGFDYWLNIIRLLGGNSPVLVVKNVFDNRDLPIAEREWKTTFSNVKEFVTVNCSLPSGKDHGMDRLWRAIKYNVGNLERIGELWGRDRIAIRQALEEEAETQPFISYERYWEICKEKGGVQDEKEALHISDFLHHLGVIIHFQKDEILCQTVILHPEWGTAAVYKILNDLPLQKQRGLLHYDELTSRIWGKDDPKQRWKASYYPSNKYLVLLRLMQHFELCFPIEDSFKRQYIVPALLEADEPKELNKEIFTNSSKDKPVLRFVFEYGDFMPKGIISRFMVRLYFFIEREMYWREGVLMHYPDHDATALVIQNTIEKCIHIYATGSDRKIFLHIIRQQINSIHHGFGEKLKVHEKIPCNCSRCKNNPDAYFFEYRELRDYQKDHIPIIRCRLSRENVLVQGLISDVAPNQASRVRGRLGEEEVVLEEPDIEEVKETPSVSLSQSSKEEEKSAEEEGTIEESDIEEIKRNFDVSPPQIFIAHHIEDEELRRKFQTYIEVPRRLGNWGIWSTADTQVGTNQLEEMKKNLEKADVIVFLISGSFLASDLYYDHIQSIAIRKYENKSAQIVPVYLSGCLCDGLFFDDLGGLPNEENRPKYVTHWNRQDEAWTNVAEGIKKIIDGLLTS